MQIKPLAACAISQSVCLMEMSASFVVIELNALQPHLKDAVCITYKLENLTTVIGLLKTD